MTNKSRPHIPVIGVTGGIGGGKSTVARYLEKAGARVIDADRLAKEILWNDPEISRKVIAAFGENICRNNGIIDKKLLVFAVFKDNDSIERLNDIIHPEVIRIIKNTIAEVKKSGSNSMIAVDAALIYEAGIEQLFDTIISVIADDNKRIDRVVLRDEIPEEAVKNRMRLQAGQDEHRKRSDYVIDNSGNIEDLERQTRLIINKIIG